MCMTMYDNLLDVCLGVAVHMYFIIYYFLYNFYPCFSFLLTEKQGKFGRNVAKGQKRSTNLCFARIKCRSCADKCTKIGL